MTGSPSFFRLSSINGLITPCYFLRSLLPLKPASSQLTCPMGLHCFPQSLNHSFWIPNFFILFSLDFFFILDQLLLSSAPEYRFTDSSFQDKAYMFAHPHLFPLRYSIRQQPRAALQGMHFCISMWFPWNSVFLALYLFSGIILPLKIVCLMFPS